MSRLSLKNSSNAASPMRVVTTKNLIILGVIAATFALVWLLRQLGIVTSVHESTLALICINIILAVSLNLITGFTGQFSLGHAGFMSIGAYTTALILLRFPTVWGFLAGLVIGGILAMIAGIIIGFPTLRLKGDYLAIATLGFAEIIRVVFQNMEITGGPSGLASIPRMASWPWMIGLTILTILVINNFINSYRGRACIAIREDEVAAEAMGINSTKYKIIAFALGAFFAGIAGGLYASYFYFIAPGKFNFLTSINVLVIVVLGGLGSLSGSVIAAVILTVLTTMLRGFTGVNNIIYAILLIAMMLFRPKGLMGTIEVTDLLEKLRLFKRKEQVE
ncbi:MAG: branched-chain amino acid ABC transporter permease [Coriobacteriia bacterium]|nr:branched-chain amino acid ABC transporter permease [Coriobacteriia bacterium]